MEIVIRQKMALATNEYDIQVDGRHGYYAFLRYRNWHNYIDIVSARNLTPAVAVEVKCHRPIFRWRFSITINQARTLQLEEASLWGHDFVLEEGTQSYRFIPHKDLSVSMFLNDQQVGHLAHRNLISVLGNDKYLLRINHDADLALLLAVSIVMDYIYSKDTGVNWGRWRESSPPDHNWQPTATPS